MARWMRCARDTRNQDVFPFTTLIDFDHYFFPCGYLMGWDICKNDIGKCRIRSLNPIEISPNAKLDIRPRVDDPSIQWAITLRSGNLSYMENRVRIVLFAQVCVIDRIGIRMAVCWLRLTLNFRRSLCSDESPWDAVILVRVTQSMQVTGNKIELISIYSDIQSPFVMFCGHRPSSESIRRCATTKQTNIKVLQQSCHRSLVLD